jgi:hypothetical protein
MWPFLIKMTAYLMELIGRLRRWLTFRRVLGIVLFLTLLLLFRQILAIGIDVSFLFGLDLGLVAEVSALLIIISVRDRVMPVAYVVRRGLLRIRPISRLLRRSVRRALRSRPVRPILPPPPEDHPAAWALA